MPLAATSHPQSELQSLLRLARVRCSVVMVEHPTAPSILVGDGVGSEAVPQVIAAVGAIVVIAAVGAIVPVIAAVGAIVPVIAAVGAIDPAAVGADVVAVGAGVAAHVGLAVGVAVGGTAVGVAVGAAVAVVGDIEPMSQQAK